MSDLSNLELAPELSYQITKKLFPLQQTLTVDYHNLPLIAPPAPPKFAFSRKAIANLSWADQHLFEVFGQGPLLQMPYTCIHHPFEAMAEIQPTAVAAEHLGDHISYGELNRQANRLARLLSRHGVTAGDNLSLFVKRSIPMLVGLMASLKVGAAYVPQDVGVVPEPQLRHIINVTASKVVLTLSSFKHLVPEVDGVTVLAIDELMAEPFDSESAARFDTQHRPDRDITRDDHCFILFTSGTTGNPNGVQVTHGNVCNIILTEPGDLGMRPGYRVGQILSISFDMSAWEILGALSHGSTLVIRGKEFGPVVEDVDVIISTPTILSTFDADKCHRVKTVAVAGEPCPQSLADTWSRFCTFYNSCGPTETTIVNTMQPYRGGVESLSIGKPTPNNTVYVLDKDLNPLPIGEIGEMWAGGDCVTAGYLNNEELTGDRYRPDPFLGNGRMMFRTRDLGRWTPDGELEHYGRTDDQVKIRGFRVELDSVTAQLESIPACRRAVTLKLDSRNLVAFVSPESVSEESAKNAVDDALPYYCVPAMVISLPELPMTSRGKIDKRQLMALAEAEKAARGLEPEEK